MIDYSFKATDESTFDNFANTQLWIATSFVDKIGPIANTTGYHVNVRNLEDIEERELELPDGVEIVYPETPYRVWQ